jgi:nitrate/nitrite transport system permease protein
MTATVTEPLLVLPAQPAAPAALVPPTIRSGSRGLRALIAAGWAALGLAAVVGLWALAASRVAELPTPAETLTTVRELLRSPFRDDGPNAKGIGIQLLTSLQRVFYGFGLAALIGVPFGIAVGASRRAWQAANPVIQLLRPVSPLAWFPIWLVVFKDAGQAAIWVIFVTALWPTVVNTASGVAAIPADHRNVAKVFRFGRLASLRHIVLPGAMPSIVTGLRLSMGTAWMVIVAVEMLSGGVGVGFFVWDSYNALSLSRVIAAIVFIGVIGVVLDLLFLRLAKAVAIEEVHP